MSALQAAGFSSADAANVTTEVRQDGPDADADGTLESVLYVNVSLPFTELWGMVYTPPNLVSSIAIRVEDQDWATCGPT